MNATGVFSAQPAVGRGAVRMGWNASSNATRQAAHQFAGVSRPLKARATLGRRVARPMALKVVAEKVVGIDLGTTNSAVRASSSPDADDCRPPGACARFSLASGGGAAGQPLPSAQGLGFVPKRRGTNQPAGAEGWHMMSGGGVRASVFSRTMTDHADRSALAPSPAAPSAASARALVPISAPPADCHEFRWFRDWSRRGALF